MIIIIFIISSVSSLLISVTTILPLFVLDIRFEYMSIEYILIEYVLIGIYSYEDSYDYDYYDCGYIYPILSFYIFIYTIAS